MQKKENIRNTSNTCPPRPFILYLLFAAIYLGIQMFQGLSYLDIGMYMSGYQHFLDDPYASYFLGQWFLSFDLTALICKAFCIESFMGLRILHLIYILVTQTIVYAFLRRYIPQKYIITGLLVCTLAHYGSYTEINYNDYSAFLLMLSIITFHRGAIKDNTVLVLLSGFIAGTAIFFRIVNITYIGIPLLSCLISVKWKIEMKAWRRLSLFYIGMATGICFVIIIAKIQGLTEILSMTFSDITSIAGDGSNKHSMRFVLARLYDLYDKIAANAVFLFLLCSLVVVAKRSGNRIVRFGLLTSAFILTMLTMHYSLFSSNTTMAICIIGGAILIFFNNDAKPSFAHLLLLSLYLPLVLPLGSNAEPSFYGKELCFLPLPMALYAIDNTTQKEHHGAIKLMLSMVCFGFVFFNIIQKQMEEGNRIACRYTINSKLTRGILTTTENAEMYNHLITELSPIVPKGSYMICSFSLPMISMLDCKPWGVYFASYTTDTMNDRYIDVAWQHTGKLPYLLIGEEDEWIRHLAIMRKLKTIKPYKTIWTDGRFSLLCPTEDNKQ